METIHLDTGGGSHLIVAVEIETADSTEHHHALKAQQYLEIVNVDLPEKWTIEVTGMDSEIYKINFIHPTTGVTTQSGEISADSNADNLRTAIDDFFWNNYGGINVELQYFDADENLLDTSDDAVKYLYTVSLLKRLEGFSFSTATIISGGTAA
jgi:hypothetical protein